MENEVALLQQTEDDLIGEVFKFRDQTAYFERQLDPKRNKHFDMLSEKFYVRNKIDPRFLEKRGKSDLYYTAGYWQYN